MKRLRKPNDVHKPLAAYSHQAELDSTERRVIMSGQVGMRMDGTVPADPIAQLTTALDNIHRNLQAANMDISDLVKLTFYIVGDMDADKRRTLISDYLGDHEPTMTLLFVAALAAPQFKVEIDAIASRAT